MTVVGRRCIVRKHQLIKIRADDRRVLQRRHATIFKCSSGCDEYKKGWGGALTYYNAKRFACQYIKFIGSDVDALQIALHEF